MSISITSLLPTTASSSPINPYPSQTTPSLVTATPTATHRPWYLQSNGEPSTLALVLGIHVLVLVTVILLVCCIKCCCCRGRQKAKREQKRRAKLDRANGWGEVHGGFDLPRPVSVHAPLPWGEQVSGQARLENVRAETERDARDKHSIAPIYSAPHTSTKPSYDDDDDADELPPRYTATVGGKM